MLFYGGEFLALKPQTGGPLLVMCHNCLFSIFAATLENNWVHSPQCDLIVRYTDVLLLFWVKDSIPNV